MKRNALGRGLDSLISMDDIQTGGSSAITALFPAHKNFLNPLSGYARLGKIRRMSAPRVEAILSAAQAVLPPIE